jgi:hypothetical protein
MRLALAWNVLGLLALTNVVIRAVLVRDQKVGGENSAPRYHLNPDPTLGDTPTAATPPLKGGVEFPLSINVQDAKGNILKMRLQLKVTTPKGIHQVFSSRGHNFGSNGNCSTSRDAPKPRSWRPELDGRGAPAYGFA